VTHKLLNILVCPGDVFDEVVGGAPALENWRVPTLLVCLAGIVQVLLSPGESSAAKLAGAAPLPAAQALELAGVWPLVSSLAVCLAAWLGTIWSAFVLWFIGRVFLRVRFSFLKTLEVVGLCGIILVLGTIVTELLIGATGDATARPSLSLLAGSLDPGRGLRHVLDIFNFFHLWSAAVLAAALSKLAGVSFREAAFWVFGYWVVGRTALIVLS
jgi:hypothetical protein